MQTIKLLDSLKETRTKNKWRKVAEMQGIPNKSTVVKWNKDRKKIFAELALNKQKEKKTNVREARQRRKRSATKGRNERYPKAASLLVSEFKLRRARGYRVSKLWFCKQMKLKIQQAYGKNEAAKFKASSNWFQRFKKRHNIALRNRTNKKKDSADDARATIQMFHRELRKVLKSKRRRNNNSTDPKVWPMASKSEIQC